MSDDGINFSTAQFKDGTPSRVYLGELKQELLNLAKSSGEDLSKIGDPWIRELAGQAGADFRTVKNWLNGESTINDNTYNKLADVVSYVKLQPVKEKGTLNAILTTAEATGYIIDWMAFNDSVELDEKIKSAIVNLTQASISFRKEHPNDDLKIIDHHRSFKIKVTEIFDSLKKDGLYLSYALTPRYNQPPPEMWGDEAVNEVRCLIYFLSDEDQNFGSIKPNWRKYRTLPLF